MRLKDRCHRGQIEYFSYGIGALRGRIEQLSEGLQRSLARDEARNRRIDRHSYEIVPAIEKKNATFGTKSYRKQVKQRHWYEMKSHQKLLKQRPLVRSGAGNKQNSDISTKSSKKQSTTTTSPLMHRPPKALQHYVQAKGLPCMKRHLWNCFLLTWAEIPINQTPLRSTAEYSMGYPH